MADRRNKSKEEILRDMENQIKVQKTRKFVREQFYPILCESTESVQDADIFLQSFSNMVMESFLALMKNMKFSELKLDTKLDSKSPQFENLKKLIQLFNEKDVKESQDLIDGMKEEIRYFYREDMKKRKLKELSTNWLIDGTI